MFSKKIYLLSPTWHISGWLTEAAWGAMLFYTHLKIAVISICLLLPEWATVCFSSLFPLQVCTHDKCILLSRMPSSKEYASMTPLHSSICHPAWLNYDTIPLTLRENACREIVSDLSLFKFPLSSLCPTRLLLFNKCFRLRGDWVEISLDWHADTDINWQFWTISRLPWREVFPQPVVLRW